MGSGVLQSLHISGQRELRKQTNLFLYDFDRGQICKALKPAQDYQQVQCESYGWELDGKFSQCLAGKQVRPQRLNKTTGTSGC